MEVGARNAVLGGNFKFPIDTWVVDTKRGPLVVGLPTRDVVLGGNPPCHSLCPLLWSLGDQHVGDQMMMIS